MRVLVLCTGNSARSQMAEGFLRALDPRLEVDSAGTVPAPRVHPLAVEAMREIGIDITGGTPKHVDTLAAQPFDLVITVCDHAARECPASAGSAARRVHFGFADPAAAGGSASEQLEVFRRVRDEITARLRAFYEGDIRPQLTKQENP